MAIQVTKSGDLSYVVNIVNGNILDIFAAITSAMLGQGYTVYDNISTCTKCFVNTCADGVSKKYIWLSIGNSGDVAKLQSYAYGRWDLAAHAGVDQGSTMTDALYNSNILFSLTKTTLYLFISPRYYFATCLYNTYVYGGGVVEFARDNPNDLPASGFPSYFITTDSLLSGTNSNATTAGSVGGVPRDRAGNTGTTAADGSALVSPIGIHSNKIGAATAWGATLMGGSSGGVVMGFTPHYYTHLFPASDSNASLNDYRGRVFGIKMLPPNLYSFGMTLNIPCDENGFSNSSGVSKLHFCMGNYCFPL